MWLFYIIRSATGKALRAIRLRDIDNINLSAESFVIFKNNNQLIPTITRKTMIRYEYDSECIFVCNNKRKNCYVFVLDRRISLRMSSDIEVLFKSIKQKFVQGKTGDGSVIDGKNQGDCSPSSKS